MEERTGNGNGTTSSPSPSSLSPSSSPSSSLSSMVAGNVHNASEWMQATSKENSNEAVKQTHQHHRSSKWMTGVWCSLFVLLGPAVVLVNNTIVKGTEFKFPIALSLFGCIPATLLAAYLVFVVKIDGAASTKMAWRFYLFRVLPVGFFAASSVFLGNSALVHLSASLTQMMKSFTPVVTVILLQMFQIATPSRLEIICVVFIALFSLSAALGSVHASFIGLIYIISSVFAEALRMVLIQKLLSGSGQLSGVESQLYIGSSIALWTFFASLIVEGSELFSSESRASDALSNNTHLFFLAALLGGTVNFVCYFVIKATNVLTLKVLVTVRNAGFVFFCAFVLKENISSKQLMSYVGAVLSSYYYSRASIAKTSGTTKGIRQDGHNPMLPVYESKYNKKQSQKLALRCVLRRFTWIVMQLVSPSLLALFLLSMYLIACLIAFAV
eukprot:m.3640 g.3640  ORF g.3640 m.3640 type:complete len:442 (+) comp3680_c0_seq1:63-1388(+)